MIGLAKMTRQINSVRSRKETAPLKAALFNTDTNLFRTKPERAPKAEADPRLSGNSIGPGERVGNRPRTVRGESMSDTFKPIDAILGGIMIGTGAGAYMILSKRIAGNSGVLKAIVTGPRDAKVAYALGLVVIGIISRLAAPDLFETPSEPTAASALWGIVLGIGTTLGNGCTSGHGLCGISRFSLRSLVAVPVFLVAAIVTSTVSAFLWPKPNFDHFVKYPAPASMIESRTLYLSLVTLGALVLALLPTLWFRSTASKAGKETPLVPAWCGLCAGAGLTIGGMVRPSVVQAGLAPYRLDFTLWALFVAALITTFICYRIAHRVRGVAEACVAADSQGPINAQLIIGAILFGAGWGATGLCPGPLIVLVAAQPTNVNAVLCLLGVVVGIVIAEMEEVRGLFPLNTSCCRRVCTSKVAPLMAPLVTPPPSATCDDLVAALASGAVIVDVRRPVTSEAKDGDFRTVNGAISVVFDVSEGTMAVEALPTLKSTPLVVICRSGNRAEKAAAFLVKCGYTQVVNGGGPLGPSNRWDCLVAHCGELAYTFRGGLCQLFDGAAPVGGGSSTYTYILTDDATKEAIIIDPVLEQARPLAHGNYAPRRRVPPGCPPGAS